jgi:RNA polymerase sigma-70 factor (ECF subfamily)
VTRVSARPWLYGIASNLVRRHYRQEERRLRAYARTGVDRVGETSLPWTLGSALAEALAVLQPAYRDVLLLFVWGELDYDEIATALSIPVGTVRSRLSRARTQVRERLERAGFDAKAERSANG